MKSLKIYVAGKVSKESVFGTHYWRDGFVKKLEELSGVKLISLDPAKKGTNQNDYEAAFGGDVFMISQSDIVVVYFSDDISVGGSQEVLVAKYFHKPVVGLAPLGGKFHQKNKEIFGQRVKDYKHPFVYATCDIVCNDIEEVAEQIKDLDKLEVKSLDVIKELAKKYEEQNLKDDPYLKEQLGRSS